MEVMTFSKAVVEFFGKKPGQNFSEFFAELKALTSEDRDYLCREFSKMGVKIAG